jgi:hypothetical protein
MAELRRYPTDFLENRRNTTENLGSGWEVPLRGFEAGTF